MEELSVVILVVTSTEEMRNYYGGVTNITVTVQVHRSALDRVVFFRLRVIGVI